jgi:hypothetical protein
MDFDFVFYHIPKCGGSSLREFFKNMFLSLGYNKTQIYIANEAIKCYNLMTSEILKDMQPILKSKKIILSHINHTLSPQLNSKFRITCLRNPIDRFISSFNHFGLMKDANADLVHDIIHYKSGLSCVYSSPCWYSNYLDYDFVIIFENLENDINQIKQIFKTDMSLDIPHIDPSPTTTHKNKFRYDNTNLKHVEIMNIIKSKLKPDIDIYNKVCNLRGLTHLIII